MSMETLRCHRNKSSSPIGTKNTIYVETDVTRKSAKYQLHPPFDLVRNRVLNISTKTNRIQRLDKIHMKFR